MSDSPAPSSAQLAVQRAMQALRRKDRREARRWAELALQLDNRLEEAWLVLAAVAAPQASLFYLRKALEINPASPRARKGMHWAAQRLRRATPASRPNRVLGVPFAPGLSLPLPALGDTQPISLRHEQTRPQRIWGAHPNRRRPALMWAAAALFVVVLMVITLAFSNSWVVMARSGAVERPVAMFFKPSLTPTNTPTSTPTNTPTPTPTQTPTPTPTFTPTNTPIPTNTPVPPTEAPYQPEPPIAADGRWIDVDLSDQMVYAYDGDELVNSFLVSTGTWRTPTVQGQFRIYVKYRYTDMSGPGYYLADVPYTMYFYKGYGLHGTYWHSNFGTPMSRGCINLRTEDAGWLFEWASVGTLVNVHE